MTLCLPASDPFMAQHPYSQASSSTHYKGFPLSPTDLGVTSPRSFADLQEKASGGWITFADLQAYTSPRSPPPVPTPHRFRAPPPPPRSRSPRSSTQRRVSPPTSPTKTRRDPDLYKQVLQTCFTMSAAGHKSKLMGHRMAVRLWEANRELERLVQLHSDFLYEEVENNDREKRVLEAVAQPGSFLTLSDDWDSVDLTPPPSRPATPVPCC